MKAPYLLADDLSGALEAGAAFSAAGWQVVLPLAENQESTIKAGRLVVISTETRSASAGEAGAAVRRILAERKAAGSQLLFKKIDSTLRGPIGAEVGALIAELAPRLVVICPANPAVGRTLRDGILHVDGISLEQTDFRHDPVWPAKTGDVRARLAEQGVNATGHVPLAMLAAGEAAVQAHLVACCKAGRETSVLVGDAMSTADIRTLVGAVRRTELEAVFVGSGALGSVLAEACPPSRKTRSAAMPVVGPMVVLCGSRHPASHRQVNRFAEECGAATLPASPETSLAPLVATAAAVLVSGRHLVVKYDPRITLQAPTAVADCLAELAFGLAERRLPGVFYLTGGETAFAVCRRLGGQSLEIVRELEAGVVLARLRRLNGAKIAVVTKPGGYGGDDVIINHFRHLLPAH